MSLEYMQLSQTGRAEITAAYFEALRKVEENSTSHSRACVTIQRMWRGYNARKYIQFLHSCATQIQRMWRGYVGRERAAAARQDKKLLSEKAYFDQAATKIQKIFRGKLSRQDRQDFYKRKRYIERVTAKSAQLQEAVLDYEVNQRTFEEEKATEEEAKQFEGMAQQLHHLLGTSSIPGVFTSPYGASFETSAYGIPMEDHLKDAFHNRQVRIRRKQEAEKKSARAKRRSSRGYGGAVDRQKNQEEGQEVDVTYQFEGLDGPLVGSAGSVGSSFQTVDAPTLKMMQQVRQPQ